VTSTERQARLARLYDAEILPAYASRFAALLARAVEPRPGARVVEIGCATGALTLELARRFDRQSLVVALDESPAFIAEARTRLAAESEHAAEVTFDAHADLLSSIPVTDGAADLVVSNLALAGAADPRAAVKEAARVVAPGGVLALSAALRGTWAEFLDLFREVLRESGRQDRLSAVDRYVAALPDAEGVIRWFEEAGLRRVQLTTARWEVLFKSAREFFFAPLVELGPLADWKRLSGRGDQMQDVFFFTKEAIDTYFKDRVFAVTIVAGVVTGEK
jgi:ubiquinone/menaquinone biosynthesis C-methylase UbiE